MVDDVGSGGEEERCIGFKGAAFDEAAGVASWLWSAVKETDVGRTAGADCGRERIAPLITDDEEAIADDDDGTARSRLMLRLATVGVVKRPRRLSRLRLRLRRASPSEASWSLPMANFRR